MLYVVLYKIYMYGNMVMLVTDMFLAIFSVYNYTNNNVSISVTIFFNHFLKKIIFAITVRCIKKQAVIRYVK